MSRGDERVSFAPSNRRDIALSHPRVSGEPFAVSRAALQEMDPQRSTAVDFGPAPFLHARSVALLQNPAVHETVARHLARAKHNGRIATRGSAIDVG